VLQSYLPLFQRGSSQVETIVVGIMLMALLQLAPSGVWSWLMSSLPDRSDGGKPDTSLRRATRTRSPDPVQRSAPGQKERKQFSCVIAVF
jgi:branched-chain amino acid transport system permease protein